MIDIDAIDFEAVANHSLDALLPRVSWCGWANRAFNQPTGYHYKLLGYLASHIKDSLLIDAGTGAGASALAMAGGTNYVLTVDPHNCGVFPMAGLPIARQTGRAQDLPQWLLREAALVLIDVRHDGIEELAILGALRRAQSRALLVVDDIHLNRQMREFWESIPERKHDVTEWCHTTGTGLVQLG